MKERNELLKEKNGYLRRIAQSLDGGLVASDEEVPVEEEDFTMKE